MPSRQSQSPIISGEADDDDDKEETLREFLETIQEQIRNLFLSRTDDQVDRLNHTVTVIILLVFAVLVSEAQFVGDPIHCWCPAEFTGAFEAYTNEYCWVKNTYFIPFDEDIPTEASRREDAEITYYQWTPLILLFQAFMFKIPDVFWKMLHCISGADIDNVCIKAEATQCDSPEERKLMIHRLAFQIDRWLWQRNAKKELRGGAWSRLFARFIFFNEIKGAYMTCIYIFIKFTSLANVIGQFFILNAFMATNYNMYGFEYIKMLQSGETMRESSRFPRITLCDFEVRQLQNVKQWTVQCTLPINLFNEKIFIFLWFWFFMVACLTGVNIAGWIYTVSMRQSNYKFVKKYLLLSGNKLHDSPEKELCRKFADSYFGSDGCLVLRMIGSNSTDVVLMDLISHLWRKYTESQHHKGLKMT